MARSTQVFLRSHGRDKDGKRHNYFSRVETVRTPDGPRQRRLCYLGKLHHREQTRWHKAVEVFHEDGQSRQLKVFSAEADLAGDDPGIAGVRPSAVCERTFTTTAGSSAKASAEPTPSRTGGFI